MLATAQWIEQNTDRNAVIGSWNAGIFSYFTGRQVVNLDGVINDEAIEAIRRKRLFQYILDRRIEYIIDDPKEADRFMDRFGGKPDWKTEFPIFHVFKPPHPSGKPGNVIIRRRIERGSL